MTASGWATMMGSSFSFAPSHDRLAPRCRTSTLTMPTRGGGNRTLGFVVERDRLHAERGFLTPMEMEIKYLRTQGLPMQAA